MNAKAREQPVKMRFHRPPRHIQLLGNFIVIAAL
jgi:hypothetical protein